MKKKESLNKESDSKSRQSGFSSGLTGISGLFFSIGEFLLGLFLLPLVYSSSVAFLRGIGLIEKSCQNYFWSGVITFLLFYLLIWEPEMIYSYGQRLLELIFSFFQPFVKVAPFLLPIFTIILFLTYELLSIWIKQVWLIEYFIFLIGFSVVLHLVFSAKSIGSKKGDFLKANYIFGFSFVYIINIMLLALFFSLLFKQFSFFDFFRHTFSAAGNIFYAVFKQIFLR